MYLYIHIHTCTHLTWLHGLFTTSSTAQGGGGSFKNRKPIGEVGLLWVTDGRAKPLMDRQVVEVSSLSLSFCLFLWLSTYLPTRSGWSNPCATSPRKTSGGHKKTTWRLSCWYHQKRSKSGRPAQCLNLTTSSAQKHRVVVIVVVVAVVVAVVVVSLIDLV